jgi:group I intron endonuclease
MNILWHLRGVYKIVNNHNGKCYVGATKDIRARYKQHLKELRNNRHHCKRLQEDFNKYGIAVFKLCILKKCPQEYLPYWEKIYIQRLQPFYND